MHSPPFTFGKHRGEPICNVPTGYLRWAIRECSGLAPWFADAIADELDFRELREHRPARPRLTKRTPAEVATAVDEFVRGTEIGDAFGRCTRLVFEAEAVADDAGADPDARNLALALADALQSVWASLLDALRAAKQLRQRVPRTEIVYEPDPATEAA